MFFSMASSCKSRAQRNNILTLEFLYFTRNRGAIQRFYGGSAAEGTNLADSDIDKMIVAPNITVCRDKARFKDIKGNVFMSETSGCRPGYTKLIPVKLDESEKTIFNDHGKTIDDMLEESDDGKFLSSDKIVEFWMNFLTKRNTSAPTPEYRHGPCATAVSEDTHGNITGKIGGNIEQDFAHALVLDDWPIDADEWFVRKRKYGWPSREMIEKIKKLKCHVVAVGDRMSVTSSKEWRFSFLLGERELVWNFNDIQMQCYLLMKKILKYFINQIAPDELSSYHMKTIMFWELENNRPDIWEQKHLLHCLRNSLVSLKICVEGSRLEHYIDRRKNMLLGKLEDVRKKEKVIECIDKILREIVPSVLQCVDGIDLLSTWFNSGMKAQDFVQLCIETKDSRITFDFDKYKSPLEHFHMGISAFGVNVETVLQDFSTLALYHEAYDENRPSNDIEDNFSNNVRMYMNIRIAITLIKKFIDSKNETEAQQKLKKLRKLLAENVDIDAISGRLYLATYLIRIGNYEEVISLVRTFLHSKTKHLIYTGQCSKSHNIVVSQGTAMQKGGLPSPFNSDGRFLSVANDVMFSNEDVSFVPYAMQFECMMDRAFLIHPLVYMFYLAFLSCRDADNGYMDSLETAVDECKGSLHSYRHLNILGHCHFLNGNYQKALECYKDSLKQTAHTKRQNAAAYHLIIVSFHSICGGYEENAECIYHRQ